MLVKLDRLDVPSREQLLAPMPDAVAGSTEAA
jgi:hypothetical protein